MGHFIVTLYIHLDIHVYYHLHIPRSGLHTSSGARLHSLHILVQLHAHAFSYSHSRSSSGSYSYLYSCSYLLHLMIHVLLLCSSFNVLVLVQCQVQVRCFLFFVHVHFFKTVQANSNLRDLARSQKSSIWQRSSINVIQVNFFVSSIHIELHFSCIVQQKLVLSVVYLVLFIYFSRFIAFCSVSFCGKRRCKFSFDKISLKL